MLHLLILAIGLVIGALIGIVCTTVILHKDDKPLGSIIFDEAVSEDIPYLGVKHHSDLELISGKKIVRLRVEHIKADSQK